VKQVSFKGLYTTGISNSLPELENKFEKADKATFYRTFKTFETNKANP